jgi:hypothetical protein
MLAKHSYKEKLNAWTSYRLRLRLLRIGVGWTIQHFSPLVHAVSTDRSRRRLAHAVPRTALALALWLGCPPVVLLLKHAPG